MPRTRTELSYKEERFAHKYIETNGNGTQAVKGIYKAKNDNVAAVTASNLIRKSKIQKRIAELARDIDIDSLTKENLLLNVAQMAHFSKNESIRVKASELQARLQGLMVEKREDVTPQNVAVEAKDLENVSTEQLLSTLTARLKLSNAGIKPKTDDNSVTVSTADAQNDALSRVSIKSDSENVDKSGGGVQTCGSRTPSIEGKLD